MYNCHVTAIKLTGTPPEEDRKYDLRGWTLFESRVIDGKGTGAIPDSNDWKVGHPWSGIDPGTLNVIVKERAWLAHSCSILGRMSQRGWPY